MYSIVCRIINTQDNVGHTILVDVLQGMAYDICPAKYVFHDDDMFVLGILCPVYKCILVM